MNKTLKQKILFAFIPALTLGLAPFSPPHIVGKIKWILGGAKGMQAMDWFDLFLHGLPWVYLIFVLGKIGISLINRSTNN